MQICGKSVDLEEIKTAQAELEALMSDPALLSQMEAKIAEMSTKLNDFKPEIPELPNLQQALSDLGSITNSAEMQTALKQLKQDFGGVVDNLNELIEKVNPKINELLNSLPDASTLVAIADGSLVGEALTNALQEVAIAEAKLARQLAVGGLPTVDSTTICNEVPNIEVQTVTETVTVTNPTTQVVTTTQVETKKKVELPAEPIVPKAVPVVSAEKPPQTETDLNARNTAKVKLSKAQKEAVYDYTSDTILNGRSRADLSAEEKASAKRVVRAHVFWYYTEVARIIGIADPIVNRTKLRPARYHLTLEDAEQLVPVGNRKDLLNLTKTKYDAEAISTTFSFEDAIGFRYEST